MVVADECGTFLFGVTARINSRITLFCMQPVPLFRARLTSAPANGHVAFIPQIRKLVFEYCNDWPSSANTRTFIQRDLISFARNNPHVEVVVKQRNRKEPIVRGFYGRLLYWVFSVLYMLIPFLQ